MSTRNLQWLHTELAHLLNFDPDSPDAAYLGSSSDPWALINSLAQEAYERIILDAITSVGSSYMFARYVDLTWLSTDVTKSVPSNVDYTAILDVRDVTNDTVGESKWIRPLGSSNTSELWWISPGTLQWGTQGPGSDRTLRIWWVGADELVDELSEPTLIPFNYRQLWKWTTAVLARRYKDEDNLPERWLEQEDHWRTMFHNSLANGSPRGPAAPFIVEPQNNDILY